jgi:hypothetical protein
MGLKFTPELSQRQKHRLMVVSLKAMSPRQRSFHAMAAFGVVAGLVIWLELFIRLAENVTSRPGWIAIQSAAVLCYIGIVIALRWWWINSLVSRFTRSHGSDGRLLYCLGCDYDLRGVQEQTDHCPECGRAIIRFNQK